MFTELTNDAPNAAGPDGIQAETDVLISRGEVTITTADGSGNSSLLEDWGFWAAAMMIAPAPKASKPASM